MNGRQQIVGWLGLLLIIVNLLGPWRSAFSVVARKPGGLPGGGQFGIPDIPGVPQGPLTGIPFSPVVAAR